MVEALDALLAQARGGGFSLERVPRSRFDEPGRMRALHDFSNRLMAEPFEHFVAHAQTNDELHVYRRREDGDVVGFQFWRALDGGGPHTRVVLGGKLRIAASARRHGLHLVSGLRVLAGQRRMHPTARIVRLGVVSLFGFVSLARRLTTYGFVDAAGPHRDLVPIVDEVTRVSRYHFDADSGLVRVGIRVTPETLASYPAAYFARSEAQAYLARNPGFADNGCYLAFAFEPDADNLQAVATGAVESLRPGGPSIRDTVRQLLERWPTP